MKKDSNTQIPIYRQFQNRNTKPAFFETRANIKIKRRSGELQGWFQQNGSVFILSASKGCKDEEEIEGTITSFESVWHIRPSGYAGPCVWQMKRI